MKLVIASTNAHKIREIKSILKDIFKGEPPFDILSLKDFSNYKQPEETGASFEENAIIKATDAAQKLNCLVVADDSGLVVPILKGAPGIYSARYAANNASDAENRAKLLKELKDVKEENRLAYYECCAVLASPEGVQKSSRGVAEGRILEEEHGRNGFGYDSLFLKHEYNKTFAELNEELKNKISHRRKALEKLFCSYL